MTKSSKILIGVAILLFGFLFYLESTADKPLDLKPYYTSTSKKPLGSKAFYTLFKDAKKDAAITEIKETLYTLDKKNTLESGSIVFFNNYIDLDKQSYEVLTDYVKEGNDALIAVNFLPRIIQDSLGIKTDYILQYNAIEYSGEVLLENSPAVMKSPIEWDLLYFSTLNEPYEVLGYAKATHLTNANNTEQKPNFIRIPLDKGNLYLHTFPEAFSNMFLLYDENYAYVEDILNILDLNHHIYIDKHNKSGNERIQSILHYITDEPALSLAYKTMIALCLLLVLFESKRKQRSIPVITPLPNKTYEFAQTVSLMYLDKKEYKQLTEKEIFQFFHYIRNELKIDTNEVNDFFLHELSTKLGRKTEDVRRAFDLIKVIQQKKEVSKDEVYALHKEIEFLKQ